ncbi:phenylacetyl-CoA ligase [Paxillus ammoniavirescens]|nr:phenylacetyl-CoA ligase [Paxillus ammoniavirescens]
MAPAQIFSPVEDLPRIPDDLTLAQFTLDYQHPCRPVQKTGTPWIIEEHTGRRIGVEELRTRTYGLANALKIRYDISFEDRTRLPLKHTYVDYLVATWAAHRLGAIMSGANPLFTTAELVYQIEATKATVVITHPDSLPVALSAARETGLHSDRIVMFDTGSCKNLQTDTVETLITQGLASPPRFTERKLRSGEGKTKVAFLSFSSGTTGKPKAVAIPHYAPIANVIQIASLYKVNDNHTPWEGQGFRPGDIFLPLYHIYGLVYNTHFVFFAGMSIVLSTRFNFTDFLKSIDQYRITHLFLVPPHVVLLCKHPDAKNYDLSSVRYIVSGGAPLAGETLQQLAKRFPNAYMGQGYGTTESSTGISIFPLDKKQDLSGSSGKLYTGVTARVERPDGSLAEFDELGELIIKSPSLALGYANNADATRETFVNGWYRTGDEVRLTSSGEVFVVDRLKEMIKVRGFQVAPAELEGCILDHPDVADTCVVSIQDEYSGELPFAYVVLHPGPAARVRENPGVEEEMRQSIMKHVADNKVAYKKLAGGVEFIEVIPKNPSGKLLRRVLRDRARHSALEAKAKL